MPQLLHIRLGQFFAAVSGDPAARQPWRRALSGANGIANTLEMTARLDEMAHRACRAIEWRSATQAWLDLGTGRGSSSPWAIADQLRAAATELLPVDVACGVASSKTAARAASALAAPRGLVVVLPGYESSILPLAARAPEARADRFGDAIDEAPFRPSFAPRAIVRSCPLPEPAGVDDALAELVMAAHRGLTALEMLAATIRVQFTTNLGTREAFASLPGQTASPTVLAEATAPLGKRAVAGATGPGQLMLSLGQLVTGPTQPSLFVPGTNGRYDHGRVSPRRRFA